MSDLMMMDKLRFLEEENAKLRWKVKAFKLASISAIQLYAETREELDTAKDHWEIEIKLNEKLKEDIKELTFSPSSNYPLVHITREAHEELCQGIIENAKLK